MLRIVVHRKTNVSHGHMIRPAHSRAKLVVCCALHAWWLHTYHCRASTAIFLVPVCAPCYISLSWSYRWLRCAGGEHCVLTRLWFHSTHVANVTLLPAEALCCLSQSTRLMVSVRWRITAFSIVLDWKRIKPSSSWFPLKFPSGSLELNSFIRLGERLEESGTRCLRPVLKL